MMRGLMLVLALALSGCAVLSPPPPPPARSEARRVQRPAYRPVLQPVRNHVSDSVVASFPALDPPVADEAIYGSDGMPGRIMRGRLSDPGLAEAPVPATPQLAASEDPAK